MPRLQHYTHDLHDAFKEELHMRVDLHSTVKGSDKVYILTVVKFRANSVWHVCCWNGRRGHGLTQQPYGSHHSYQNAKAELRKRQREKENKGYKFIHEEEQTGMGVMTKNPTTGSNNLQSAAPGMSMPPLTPMSVELNGDALAVLKQLRGLKSMPNMQAIDSKEFARSLRSVESVMFKMSNLKLVYAFLQVHDWLLYDALSETRPTPELIKVDYKGLSNAGAASLQGMGWLGTLDSKGHFEILDLIALPSIPNIHRKEWRARRQMMNIAYDTLYPGVDPYDASNSLRFIDYIHDDKNKAFATGRGQIFAAFNVRQTLMAKFYVSNN